MSEQQVDPMILLLREMGGKAHQSEIVRKASETLFPVTTNHKDLRSRVSNRLLKLQRWGEVYKDFHGNWYIKK